MGNLEFPLLCRSHLAISYLELLLDEAHDEGGGNPGRTQGRRDLSGTQLTWKHGFQFLFAGAQRGEPLDIRLG